MKKQIYLSLILALGLALLLAACDQAPPPPDTKGVLAIPTSTPYGVPSYNFVLSYTETGGQNAQEKKLIVDGVGNASYTDGEYAVTLTLDDVRFAGLRDLFEQNKFSSMADSYQPDRPVSDSITKTVMYTSRDNVMKKVVVANGSNIPASWSLIDSGIAALIVYMKSTIDQGVLDVLQVYPVAAWNLPLRLDSYAPNDGESRPIQPAEINNEIYTYIKAHYSDPDMIANLFIYQQASDSYYQLTPQFALSMTPEQVRAGKAGIQVKRVSVARFPQELNVDVSRIPATGMALQEERYRAVRDLLEGPNSLQTNLFMSTDPGPQTTIYRIRLRHGGALLQ